MTRALESLEAGWHLRGRDLPWQVGEGFLRTVLRATDGVIPSPGPLRAEVKQLALALVLAGAWQGRRPHWVSTDRLAGAWWIGKDRYDQDVCAPFVVLKDEVVATGAVLRRRRGDRPA